MPEHGSRSNYTHGGCRQECCAGPNAEYVRQYRAKRRAAPKPVRSTVRPAENDRLSSWEAELRRAAAESMDW